MFLVRASIKDGRDWSKFCQVDTFASTLTFHFACLFLTACVTLSAREEGANSFESCKVVFELVRHGYHIL